MSVAPLNAIVTASGIRLNTGGRLRAVSCELRRVERVLLLALLFLDLDGVDPREAGGAGRLLRAAERRQHALHPERAQAVGLDEALDLLDRLVRRDQLAARRRVDPVVARVHRRR